MNDPTLLRLARYAFETDFAALSPRTVHECKRRIIDSVACAAGAYTEPFCGRIRAIAGAYGGAPSARVWGSGASTSLEMAAFANGTQVRYLDLNDTWLSRGAGHPSDMIAALVAVAEGYGGNGASLVAAIVVAYELYCALCDGAFPQRELDQSTAAAVGAAAGAGRLLGLTQEQMGHALSLALAPNLNLYNVRCGDLSDWKGCAGPNAARNGVFAALLAGQGVSGPSAPVEGQGGLFELLKPFDWQVGAGEHSLLALTHLKLHPVCYHGQSAIDAALALRGAVSLDAISEIHVETYAAAHRAMASDPGRWAPANRETADHSLPYVVATALQDGRLTSRSYADERLGDASTKALMDKLRVSVSPAMTEAYPHKAQARITIRAKGGAEHRHLQDLPRGHAANPASDAELEEKFIPLFAVWGTEPAARRFLDLVWSIERMERVSLLVDALCPARD